MHLTQIGSAQARQIYFCLNWERFCYSEQINRGLFASDILKWLQSVFSDAGTTFPNIHQNLLDVLCTWQITCCFRMEFSVNFLFALGQQIIWKQHRPQTSFEVPPQYRLVSQTNQVLWHNHQQCYNIKHLEQIATFLHSFSQHWYMFIQHQDIKIFSNPISTIDVPF